MQTIFEPIKAFFFILSIVIGIFFLRGKYIFENNFETIGKILMPLYLLLFGVICAYIISNLWILKNDIENNEQQEKIYQKAFVFGLIGGIVFSIIYIIIGK